MNTQQPLYTTRSTHDLIQSILLGLVILAAGIAIGASITFLRLSRPTPPPQRAPEIAAEQTLRQIGRELNLSPQQRRQLEPIFKTHFRALSDLRAQVRPQIVAQLEQMNEEILSVLDEPQQKLWQQRVRRFGEHFPTFRGHGPREARPFAPDPDAPCPLRRPDQCRQEPASPPPSETVNN